MIKIPRGAISHNILDEIKSFFNSFYLKLDSQEIISNFEKKFAKYNKRKFCCAFPFARTAFYYSIKSLNIKKDSEVILSPITIKPILDVVLDLGLKPVFCDLSLDTLCYKENELNKKINKKTKLIFLTYLFGMVPNLNFYLKYKKKNILVIEDFSQCLNGKFKNKLIGTLGDISIYSSSSIKTLDTYGGGLAITNRQKLFLALKNYQKNLYPASRFFLIKKILINITRNFLTNYYVFSFFTYYLIFLLNLINKNTKMLGNRSQNPIKSLPKIWFQKYTSLQASIGIKKLSQIKTEDKKRIAIAERIKKVSLKKLIEFPKGEIFCSNVYWQLLIYTVNPKKLRYSLIKKGIDTSSTSLEKICSLGAYGFNLILPNVEKIYHNTLFLPCFSKMNKKQEQKIYKVVKRLK